MLSDAPDIQARARDLDEAYSHQAARYDALVVHWRTRATLLELVIAVGMVLIGTGGALGIYQQLGSIEIDPAAGAAAYAAAAAQLLPALATIVVAVLTAYVGVVQPRQKQATFGAASEACATVAMAARATAELDLSNSTLTTYCNAISGIYTSLESSAVDNQPPLPAEPPLDPQAAKDL